MADSILVSDAFYNLTRDQCTYENAFNIFIRRQGSVMTYRLIGVLTVDLSSSAEKEPKTDVVGGGSTSPPNMNVPDSSAAGANPNSNKAGTSVPMSGMEEGEVEIKSRKQKKCVIL